MIIQAEGTTSKSSDMGACLPVLGTSGRPCGWSRVEGWSVSEREMKSELTGQEGLHRAHVALKVFIRLWLLF